MATKAEVEQQLLDAISTIAKRIDKTVGQVTSPAIRDHAEAAASLSAAYVALDGVSDGDGDGDVY